MLRPGGDSNNVWCFKCPMKHATHESQRQSIPTVPVIWFVVWLGGVFLGLMELPCVMLWRPEARDCRVTIPPEAWNWLTRNPPSLGFEPRTSSIWEPTLNQLSYRCSLGFIQYGLVAIFFSSLISRKTVPENTTQVHIDDSTRRFNAWSMGEISSTVKECPVWPFEPSVQLTGDHTCVLLLSLCVSLLSLCVLLLSLCVSLLSLCASLLSLCVLLLSFCVLLLSLCVQLTGDRTCGGVQLSDVGTARAS